uniref:Uncharacterized protein n=1 Tax=Anguilla anguilla TaxID=7936 RepID=A0A0E9SE87_ANGAN
MQTGKVQSDMCALTAAIELLS